MMMHRSSLGRRAPLLHSPASGSGVGVGLISLITSEIGTEDYQNGNLEELPMRPYPPRPVPGHHGEVEPAASRAL